MDVAARIEGLRPFLIHGESWVQVYFSRLDDPETIEQARFSADALPDGLRVGDEVLVEFVLSVATAVRRR